MTIKLGDLADELHTLQTKLAELNLKVKELEEQKHALESNIISALQDNGIDSIRGKYATISITETVRPQIADFEEFATFVLRKKALHLFERRVSVKAYNEMKELLKGKPVPGLNEFVQQKLSVRKVTKE